MSERESVLLERGFVLHQRPFRNTSQLVECLTEGHGRIGLVAQGSRQGPRPRRALLQPFVPLRLSWIRRGELGRLTDVEADGQGLALGPEPLLAAYYVNELALRLCARGDANDEVFSCYSRCLAELAAGSALARTLRIFELRFLRALGFGLELDRDAESGEPLKPEFRYRFELERGPRADERIADHEGYWGRELLSLGAEDLHDEESLRAARRLLARVLESYLGDRPLKSRAVLKDIVARGL
ncbi:MAG TPA: DNA repair protein RecO [Gammaproteobacteria bacterium]|nr:DNA repair protein RecO [Gammaproteobacteria bacterium]